MRQGAQRPWLHAVSDSRLCKSPLSCFCQALSPMNHLLASLKKFTMLVLLSPLHYPLPNSVSSRCPEPTFMHYAACVPTPQPLVGLVQPP